MSKTQLRLTIYSR